MTNEFYKGMLEGLKNAKSYAEVVKKNFANVEEIYATNSKATPEMIAREQGAQVGITKMIEYFDLFVEFLKVYDDDDKRNESN